MKQDALLEALQAGEQAATRGFDWATALDALQKVPEESTELAEAIQLESGVAEELGDLLFAVVNVARKVGVDPREALLDATRKFEGRFDAVVVELARRGRTPEESTLDEMESIWVANKTQ